MSGISIEAGSSVLSPESKGLSPDSYFFINKSHGLEQCMQRVPNIPIAADNDHQWAIQIRRPFEKKITQARRSSETFSNRLSSP